jgi:hypothetical protein
LRAKTLTLIIPKSDHKAQCLAARKSLQAVRVAVNVQFAGARFATRWRLRRSASSRHLQEKAPHGGIS